MRGAPVGFADEGGGDAELAFAQEVHGDGAVDERGVRREGVIFGGGQGLVFEFLYDACERW